MTSRLAVVSHTPHHHGDDGLVGWGPTVTELSHLASLVDELVHVAPVHAGPAPASALPYSATNVEVVPLRPAGGDGLAAKAGLVAAVPGWAAAIRRGCSGADAVHVRCPANVSGTALAWLRLSRDDRPCWVKYAGNWRPDGPDAWSYGVQRRWLRRGFGRVVVTVNGTWPDDPPHVRPFTNPSLTDDEVVRGEAAAGAKPPVEDGLHLAFVGRLEAEKGAPIAVRVLAALHGQGLPASLDLVGDGPARDECQALAESAGVAAHLRVHGWLSRSGVHDVLEAAHVLVLPTRSEGWPKVVSEAMAFGAVPVVSAVSSIPQVLEDTGAGVAVPGTDPAPFTEAVAALVADPADLLAKRSAGLRAAPRFTYAAQRGAVVALFRDAWDLELGP